MRLYNHEQDHPTFAGFMLPVIVIISVWYGIARVGAESRCEADSAKYEVETRFVYHTPIDFGCRYSVNMKEAG